MTLEGLPGVARRLALSVALLAVPLATALSAPAHAAWSSPLSVPILAPSAPVPLSLDVAVGPDGMATAVWSEHDGSGWALKTVKIAPGGSIGTVQPLTGSGAFKRDVQVVVGPDGTATVVWQRGDAGSGVVRSARVGPDGTPDAARDLSDTAADAVAPDLALTPDGTAIVVWQQASGGGGRTVEAIRVSPTGVLDDVQHVTDGASDAASPRLATAPDGSATVAWRTFGESDTTSLHTARIAPAGEIGEAEDLVLDSEHSIYPPVLSVAPDGSATVVWQQAAGDEAAVRATRVDSGGIPSGEIEDLGDPHYVAAASLGYEPVVASAPDGTATVVWTASELDESFVVHTARIAPDGAAGEAHPLSPAIRSSIDPDLTVDDDGVATAIWHGYDPLDGDSAIEAVRISAGGGVGAVDTLAFTENEEAIPDVSSPALALAPGDAVQAVWESSIAMAVRASRHANQAPPDDPDPPPAEPSDPKPIPPAPPPPAIKPKPAISLSVKPRRATVAPGGVVKLTARLRNTGTAPAAGVRVCVRAPARRFKLRRCRAVGRLLAGGRARRTFRARLKGAPRAGTTYRLRLTATGSGTPAKRVAVRVKVR